MSKLRSKFIVALVALLCAMLSLSAALMIPKNKSADAYSGPQTATIGELYDASSSSKFKTTNLRNLYSALSSGAKSLLEVDKKLGLTESGVPVANKGVLVQFGGKVWIAAYLSKATVAHVSEGGTSSSATAGTKGIAEKGDVILTLWLAYSNKLDIWNKDFSYDIGSYPSNMYGTSYMRSVVLNNGGGYWKDVNNLDFTSTQDSGNDFARFTMSSAADSVVDYLVAPRYVQWQYQQHSLGVGNPACTCDLNNDAWGKVGSTNFPDTTYYFENLSYYSAWKDDLVWLPSLAETGFGNTGTQGLWQTTLQQRENPTVSSINWIWMRSAGQGAPYRVFSAGGSGYGTAFGNGDTVGSSVKRLIRPAIHLNLTKASGVAFDNDLSTISENVQDNKKIYDGEALDVYLPDYKRWTLVGGPYENGTGTGKASYDATTGKFSATLPNAVPTANEEVNYEITIKPSGSYRWDDNDGTEERTYRIHIDRATIKVGWDSPYSVTYGANVIQSDKTKITSYNLKDQSDLNITSIKYIVDPTGTKYSSKPAESDGDWKTAGQISAEDSKAVKTGQCVWYKIEADYHITLIASYTVKVSTDTLTVSVKGNISNVAYGEGDIVDNAKSADWLTEQFAEHVTMEGTTSKYDDADDVKKFLDDENLTVALYKDSDCTSLATLNKYSRYAVGTYYLGLKYPEDGGSSIEFKWNAHPSFEITQKEIKVSMVAADDGELTHVYGNKPVTIKYKVTDDAYAEEIEKEFPHTFTITKVIGADGDSSLVDSTLGERTPAGSYNIVGSQGTNGNFNVTFNSATYKIGKKEVTLKVADEKAPYGTNFDSYNFTDLTDVNDELATWDTPSSLEVKYYIMLNGVETELSSTLEIREYDLWARVENANYDFKYQSGKLTITKADFDMSGVKLENKAYVHDGNPHPAQISGTLPDGVSVSYRYVNMADSSSSDDAPSEIGLYLVYASFTHSNENYNAIPDKVAYIRIAATQEEADKPFPNLPSDEDIANAAQLAKKKTETKKSLDEVAKSKKEEIAALDITEEEKARANSEIDKELAAGNAAIDSATDASGVEQAFNEGKKKIEDISAACKAAEELGNKKKAAKDALEQAAKDKNTEIDNNPDLTDEEKAEAKKKVEEELANGLAAIDGATDASGVESAQSTSKTNIENIKAEHKGSFPWWIIAVIAGVLVVLAVIIIIVVKRRNSEDDEEDFYDDEYDFDDEEVEEEEDFGDDF